ncbi:MAG: T9SS type A sorting domain-containing protein [Bacteroidota bacterium]
MKKIIFVLGICICLGAHAQYLDTSLWITNGPVNAMVKSGNTLYLGGDFDYVGRSTGFAVPLDSAATPAIDNFPKVDGPVYAIASDYRGGWYIGGKFKTVGGLARKNFARIKGDGSVYPIDLSPDGPVYAIKTVPAAYGVNPYVYIGGDFHYIDGIPVNNAAQLNALKQQVFTTWTPNFNGPVYAIEYANNKLFVGGSFTTVNGNNCKNLAVVSSGRTGTDFTNANTTNGAVYALYYNPASNSLVVGGAFTLIGSSNRQRIAAIELVNQTVTAWNPNVSGAVRAISGIMPPIPGGTSTSSGGRYGESLAAVSNTIYIGGDFLFINAVPIKGFAEMSLGSTAPLPSTFTANCNGSVWSIFADKRKNRIYIGGKFTSLGGMPRHNFACIDTFGVATSWYPSAGGKVRTICVTGNTVYAGGEFPCMFGVEKGHVAAFDESTGQFTAWNPRVYGSVMSLSLSASNILYLGGSFDSIQGLPRSGLGAIDLGTGNATAFSPSCDGVVRTTYLEGNKLYLGGFFSTVAGQARRNIACVDVTTSALTTWNPDANGTVNSLTGNNSRIFAGGFFTSIGGYTRNRIASLDTLMGYADVFWDAPANDGVYTLILQGGLLYAGGWFTSMDGTARNNISCVDASSAVTAFDPNANALVRSLHVSGNSVFLSGDFTSVSSQPRGNMALYDIATNTLAPFDPGADSMAMAMLLSGNTLYAGGSFISIDGEVHAYFAALNTQYVASVESTGVKDQVSMYPNPAQTWVTVTGVPEGATIRIYSVTGQEAPSTVTWTGTSAQADISALPAGIYFVQFTASTGKTSTLKLVKTD